MPGRDPIGSVRRALKNSPWLVISVLAHVILLVGLGLFALKQVVKSNPVATTMVRVTHPVEPPDDVLPIPQPTIRDLLPETKSVVTDPDDVYFPPDTAWNDSGTLDPGDATSTDLKTEIPLSSTAIAVGIGPGIRGGGVTPFTSSHGPLTTIRI